MDRQCNDILFRILCQVVFTTSRSVPMARSQVFRFSIRNSSDGFSKLIRMSRMVSFRAECFGSYEMFIWVLYNVIYTNRHTWIRTRDEEVEAPSDNPLHHMPIRKQS